MSARKFNVLVVVPYTFLPPITGGEICSYGFMESFAELSDLSLLSPPPRPSDFTYASSIEAHFELSSHWTKYFRFWEVLKMARLIKKKRIDFVILEQPWFGLYVWMVALLSGTPFVLRCNNMEYQRFRTIGKWWWRILFYYERFVHRKARVVSYLTVEDRAEAIKQFGLPEAKALYAPYGYDKRKVNSATGSYSKDSLGLDKNKQILLFFGNLSYKPNEDAVRYLVDEINPFLKGQLQDYQIVICGKGLNEEVVTKMKMLHHFKYLGFVADIVPYIEVADVILNPIMAGGGVKTKVIDALAMNKTVVSLFSGAIGVDTSVTGNKLLVADDRDWQGFSQKVVEALNDPESRIPEAFFDEYDYDRIALKSQRFFEGAFD